jgi:Ser/Thr protein kinase RdoA (MazF antagonist)
MTNLELLPILKSLKINKNKNRSHIMLWEKYNFSVPHSRKSLSRDHTLRILVNAEVYKKIEAKELAKLQFPDEHDSSDDDNYFESRDYKPTNKDYYFEKKERERILKIAEAEKSAAEEEELETRLKANLKVDKTEYKSPDITKVIFAKYPQHKHKIAHDASIGPCFVFLPYKVVT